MKRRWTFDIRDTRKNHKERAVAHTVRQSFFFIKKRMRFKFVNKIEFFSHFLPKRVDLFSKHVIMNENQSMSHKFIGSTASIRASQSIGGKRK